MKNYETYLISPEGRETKTAETWTKQEAIDAADMAVQGRLPGCRAVVVRSDASPLAPALYEVESAAPQADETIRIKIHKGAEIVNQATGETRTSSGMYVTATQDQNSGCMVFRAPGGTHYVCEDYTIVSEGN